MYKNEYTNCRILYAKPIQKDNLVLFVETIKFGQNTLYELWHIACHANDNGPWYEACCTGWRDNLSCLGLVPILIIDESPFPSPSQTCLFLYLFQFFGLVLAQICLGLVMFLSWSRVCYLLKSLTCRLDACRDHHYMDKRLIWILAYCMSSQYKWTIVWCLSRISNYWQNCWYGLWLLYRKPIQLKNLKLFFEPMQMDHHSLFGETIKIWTRRLIWIIDFFMPSQCKRTITCCLFKPSLYIQKC